MCHRHLQLGKGSHYDDIFIFVFYSRSSKFKYTEMEFNYSKSFNIPSHFLQVYYAGSGNTFIDSKL